MSVRNCPKCHIFEAKPQIPPLEPILCTEPLEMVHIDYMSMEVMVGIKEKPVVKKCLGHRRLLHMLHPGVYHQQSYCAHYGARPLQ